MRIGIDACCWSNRRGFGRYTRELVPELIAQGERHEFVLLVDRWTAATAEFPDGATVKIVATSEQPTEAASAAGARSPLDLWRMQRAVARERLDLFYFPAVYSFFPLPWRMPAVVTIHDAIAERHPELIFPGIRSRMLWDAKMWLAIRQAHRIVTVSAASRRQIARTFKCPESEVVVVAEGPSGCFRPIADDHRLRQVRHRYRIRERTPVLLYVGGISPHKNLDGLLRAAAILRDRCVAPWQLLLVGDYENDSFHGCFAAVSRLARDLGLEERVTFTGFVPDDDLAALYNTSTLLVLPSFEEGFGLPVVEAMACGLPVAISNRGSLPEVAGEAGLLFSPDDPEEIAAALERMLNDGDLRRRLRSEGLRRSEAYTWKSASRQLLEIFEETAGARAHAA